MATTQSLSLYQPVCPLHTPAPPPAKPGSEPPESAQTCHRDFPPRSSPLLTLLTAVVLPFSRPLPAPICPRNPLFPDAPCAQTPIRKVSISARGSEPSCC